MLHSINFFPVKAGIVHPQLFFFLQAVKVHHLKRNGFKGVSMDPTSLKDNGISVAMSSAFSSA